MCNSVGARFASCVFRVCPCRTRDVLVTFRSKSGINAKAAARRAIFIGRSRDRNLQNPCSYKRKKRIRQLVSGAGTLFQ